MSELTAHHAINPNISSDFLPNSLSKYSPTAADIMFTKDKTKPRANWTSPSNPKYDEYWSITLTPLTCWRDRTVHPIIVDLK